MYLIFFFYNKYILNIFYSNLGGFNYLLILINKFWFNNLIIVLLLLFYIRIYNFKYFYFVYMFVIYVVFINFKWQSILLNFNVGLMKIHPPLLYISIIYLIYYFYSKYSRLTMFFITNLTIFTFLLGSFWALYQKIWGLYWSNDSIEILLVILCVLSIYYLHKLFLKSIFYSKFLLISFISCLLLLRLNYIYTKHNFFNIQLLFNKFINIIFFFSLPSIIIRDYCRTKFLFLQRISYYFFKIYLLLILIVSNHFNIFSIKIVYTFVINIFFFKLFLNMFNSLKKFIYFHIFIFIFIFIFTNFTYNYLSSYCNIQNLIYNKNLNLFLKYFNLKNISYHFYKNYNFFITEKFMYSHKFINMYNMSKTSLFVTMKNLINYL